MVRYTIDPIPYPPEGAELDSPVVVEILEPDSDRILRDYAGNDVGRAVGSHVGRATTRLIADKQLLERIEPLPAAIRLLDDHIDRVHTVHHADGTAPNSTEEDDDIRAGMLFPTLAAHLMIALEVYTHRK